MSIINFMNLVPIILTLIRGLKTVVDNFDTDGDRNSELAEALDNLASACAEVAAQIRS